MTTTVTPTRRAVLAACIAHEQAIFAVVTQRSWWRAQPPFMGSEQTFAAHLRALARAGLLHRLPGRHARYRVTSRGHAVALNDT